MGSRRTGLPAALLTFDLLTFDFRRTVEIGSIWIDLELFRTLLTLSHFASDECVSAFRLHVARRILAPSNPRRYTSLIQARFS